MRKRSEVALALLLPMATAGCALHEPSVLGRTVTLTTVDDRPAAKGELLAVEQGEAIVRARHTVERVPLAAVGDAQVERHNLGYKTGLVWSAIGGLVTGGALWAACRAVPGNDCAQVGAAVLGLWMVIGGGASLSMESTTRFHIERPKHEDLRIYARFPQGLPPGLDLDSLIPPAVRRLKLDPSPEPRDRARQR